jgi:hypothetical protein
MFRGLSQIQKRECSPLTFPTSPRSRPGIDDLVTIYESQPFDMMPYRDGQRKFWKPNSMGDVVVVCGFGFLFQPEQNRVA